MPPSAMRALGRSRSPSASRMMSMSSADDSASAASTLLAVTASHLAGLYGPVGRGGALILAVVGLLVVPYLVLLPVAQLVTLRKR